ncbi:MAG: hypothetical protein ABIC39_06170 [Pseudomonadota bacterium]
MGWDTQAGLTNTVYMLKKIGDYFSERRIKAPGCLFLLIFSIYVLTFSGVNLGDGLSVFLTSRSIVNKHSLVITTADFNIFSSVIPNSERGGSITIGKDGNRYLIPGILMSVLTIPLYFIGNLVGKLFFTGIDPEFTSMFFFSLFNPFVLSLLGLLIYFYLRISGQKIGKSLAWSIFFSLTTFAWLYAKTGFYEPLMAFLIFLTYLFLFLFKLRRNFIFVILAAIIYGISLFTKGVILIFFPIYILYLIFMPIEKGKKFQALFSFLSVFLLFLALLCFYNFSIYGSCLAGGYSSCINNSESNFFVFSVVHFINSFWGLLFSPGKGIIFFAPLMFLFFFNFRRHISNIQQEDIVCFAFFAASILFYSFNFIGVGTAGWGPRYLMPTLPFIIILLAKLNYNKLKQSRLLMGLAITGFLVQLPAAIVRWGNFIRAFYGAGFARGIDYLPGFSPIIWAWFSLLSIILKSINILPGTISVSVLEGFFLYQGDIPLNKIAEFNLWFLNILEINPNLFGFVLTAIFILGLFIYITGRFLIKVIDFGDL